jgi:phage repressor protein C with HTH and peptisase S24 domain
MELADRIAWVIDKIKTESEISDEMLGQKLGINKNTVIAYRKREGLIKGSALEGLAKHYNYSTEWLLKGIGEPFPGAHEKYPDVCGPLHYEVIESVQGFKGSAAVNDATFVFVPQLDGRISAGNGLVPEPAVKTQIAFRRDWIARKGKPENMLLIKVSGDSMEPTLYEGDLVLIDKRRDFLEPHGGIYAIAIDDAIMIKRLQADPSGKIRIISDNKSLYPPMEADPDQVKINGKVIWFARELER